MSAPSLRFEIVVTNRDTNAVIDRKSAASRKYAELLKADHVRRFPNDDVRIIDHGAQP